VRKVSLQQREKQISDQLAAVSSEGRRLEQLEQESGERERPLSEELEPRETFEPAEVPAPEPIEADPPEAAPVLHHDPADDGFPTLQELERRVQAASERLYEWQYYLKLLRAEADEDGVLPARFQPLIDDVFAEGRFRK
jgi:hypothetical protein